MVEGVEEIQGPLPLNSRAYTLVLQDRGNNKWQGVESKAKLHWEALCTSKELKVLYNKMHDDHHFTHPGSRSLA